MEYKMHNPVNEFEIKDIIDAYQKEGMILKSKLEKGDWAAILFERQ